MRKQDSKPEFLWGLEAIANEIELTYRQTQHLIAKGELKSIHRIGGKIYANRQALRRELGADVESVS